MKLSTIVNSLAFVAAASAQTSPGAPYDIGNYLPAVWNDSTTIEPGMLYSPDQVSVGPSYGVAQTNASADQPYIVILIDINVVLNSSTGVQSEFLHVLQPNLYAINATDGNLTFLANGPNASTVVGASYFPPTPPAGSVHHYNIMLFEQPANFTMPPNFTQFDMPASEIDRVNFNVTQFADESGLGQPVAANYFQVLNGTAAQTTTAESQTATSGVAFPSGYSFTSTTTPSSTASGTATSGTSGSVSGSSSGTASSSATSPTSSTSSASDANDFGQSFVKAVCLAVAASLPWIW